MSGSCSARSESIFRSIKIFFFFSAFIKVLYVIPSARTPALIFTVQRRRKTRFFSFLPWNALLQACSTASFAARSLFFLPHRYPFVVLSSFSLFLFALVPRFTRGIVYRYFFSLSAWAFIPLFPFFRRICFELLFARECPKAGERRSTFPVLVTLTRFETLFCMDYFFSI